MMTMKISGALRGRRSTRLMVSEGMQLGEADRDQHILGQDKAQRARSRLSSSL